MAKAIVEEMKAELTEEEMEVLEEEDLLEHHTTVNFLSQTDRPFPPDSLAELEELVESASVIAQFNKHCSRAWPFVLRLRRLFVAKIAKKTIDWSDDVKVWTALDVAARKFEEDVFRTLDE